MGEVYEAEQEQPVRRRVAVKLIKPGPSTSSWPGPTGAEDHGLILGTD